MLSKVDRGARREQPPHDRPLASQVRMPEPNVAEDHSELGFIVGRIPSMTGTVRSCQPAPATPINAIVTSSLMSASRPGRGRAKSVSGGTDTLARTRKSFTVSADSTRHPSVLCGCSACPIRPWRVPAHHPARRQWSVPSSPGRFPAAVQDCLQVPADLEPAANGFVVCSRSVEVAHTTELNQIRAGLRGQGRSLMSRRCRYRNSSASRDTVWLPMSTARMEMSAISSAVRLSWPGRTAELSITVWLIINTACGTTTTWSVSCQT